MADRAEEVVVQTTDLDKMQEGLALAYHKSMAEDLVQAYRAVDIDGSRSKSAMTEALEDALQAVQAALKLAERDDEPEREKTPEEPSSQPSV